MANITSMGIGSGLDIQGLIDKLVSAEQQPVVDRLNQQEASYQAEISAYGNLRGAVSDFQSVVTKLNDASAFQKVSAVPSDPSVFTATAESGAAEGSYSIQVSQLAQAQSVVSAAGFDSTASSLGSGTLTIHFGTVTTDADGAVTGFVQDPAKSTATINISADAATLGDVRDAINGADVGVHASIVDDGSGKRLVLKSDETGENNAFVVDVTDDDGNGTDAAGLSQLAFDVGASNLQQTRAAADAMLSIDGLDVHSASNSVSGAIEGVTLDLLSADPGATTSLDVSKNVGAVSKNVQDFVSAYNDLRKQINDLTAYDATTGTRGPLLGDAAVRSIESTLRTALSQQVGGVASGVRTLADVGITTERDGTLTLDSSKLDAALASHFDDVAALFAPLGQASSAQVAVAGHGTQTAGGQYAVDITQPATAGSYTGQTPGGGFPLTIGDATSYNFKVKVDGVLSREISLTEKTYDSADALAAEIQSRLAGDENLRNAGADVSVAYDADANALVFRSSSYGSSSTVEVQSADAAAQSGLGLVPGTGTAGLDVAGTIGGRPAQGEGRRLTATAGDPNGLSLDVSAAGAGPLGTVRFSRGITGGLTATLDRALGTNGVIDTRTSGLQASIDALTPQREQLSRRMDALRSQLQDEFNRMDQLVASLNQTSSFLSQQLGSLTANSKSNSAASRNGG